MPGNNGWGAPPPPSAASSIAVADPAGDYNVGLAQQTCIGLDASICDRWRTAAMYLGVRCSAGTCTVRTVDEFDPTSLRWDPARRYWVTSGTIANPQFGFDCNGVVQPTTFRLTLWPSAATTIDGTPHATAITGTYERSSDRGACNPASLKYSLWTTSGHPVP